MELFTDAQLQRLDIDTLRRMLRAKLGGYVIAVKDIPAHHLFYRGVHCDACPATTRRIFYPPASVVTTCGRVNRAGEPRFYCSVAAPAVFYELHARQGDCLALSTWELMEPLWVHNLGYHPNALLRMGMQRDGIAMRPLVTHSIPNETKKNRKMRHRLSLAFTANVPPGKEYRYKLSIAINECLSHEVTFPYPNPDRDPDAPRHKRIAGTVYPTMRMRGDADNAVFLPEFVDSSLRIREVRYVLVEDADEARFAYTWLTVAVANAFDGDNIQWQRAMPSEGRRRSHIVLEDGHWVLRDGGGPISDFH
ncbi:MAG TPA: hypothetical protein VMF86_14300 [Stellaceae bacterium]|nr:hypothetical protein [Stellaceae bacterium]HTW51860.1 hypothetical protein [Stellaceae bacterium]